MKCSLDRNKIEASIVSQLDKRLMESKLFIKDGELYTPTDVKGKTIVSEINKDYKFDIIKESSKDGPLKITIPDHIITKYIFSQYDSADEAYNYLRGIYMGQYGKYSLNTVSSDMWLNHPLFENPTVRQLFNFLKKINPEFKIGIVENLPEEAITMVKDNIILLKEGLINKELPEEVAHIFIALLPEDSQMYKDLMKVVLDFPLYGKVYHEYKKDPLYQKNGLPNIDKIKKEVAAKLISQYIHEASSGTADKTYGQKRGVLKELINRIFKYLRRQFYKAFPPLYTESIMPPLFQNIAIDILDGDISSLNLKKEVNPYDSIFYSKIMDNLAEGFENSELVRRLNKFSEGARRVLHTTFFTFLEKENMSGLSVLLKDPKYDKYNKIWDIISLLDEANKEFGIMKDSKIGAVEHIGRVLSKVGNALQHMEDVPEALRKVVAELEASEKNNTLDRDGILNNITEIQNYRRFVDAYDKISRDLDKLLSYIKTFEDEAEPEAKKGYSELYDIIINKSSASLSKFRQVDDKMMDVLQKHLLSLMEGLTEKVMKDVTDERKERMTKAETEHVRLGIDRQMRENITNKETLKLILSANLPEIKELVREDGSKIKLDLSKIKDISKIDYLIFLVGPTSTMADPFVTNILALYATKKYNAHVKSMNESMEFAEKIYPIFKRLSDSLGYYEAQKLIQNVQETYDYSSDNKIFERRTLLSETNRASAFYEIEKRNANITQLNITQRKYQNKNYELSKSKKDASEEEIVKLDEEIKSHLIKISELQDQIDAAKLDKEEFEENEMWRDYNDKYYENRKSYTSSDPTIIKIQNEIKAIEHRINDIEFSFNQGKAISGKPRDLMQVSVSLARAYSEKLELLDKLPKKEKEAYTSMYIDDEVNTKRRIVRHQNAWLNGIIDLELKRGKSLDEIEKNKKAYENAWDLFFVINKPTEEFWDLFKDINNRISEHTKNHNIILKNINSQLEVLEDIRINLERAIRSKTSKEISIAGLHAKGVDERVDDFASGFNSVVDKNARLVYHDLFIVTSKIKMLRRKQNILAQAPEATDETVLKRAAAAVDILTGIQYIAGVIKKITRDDIKLIFSEFYDLDNKDVDYLKNEIDKMMNNQSYSFDNINNLFSKTSKVGTVGKDLSQSLFADKIASDILGQEDNSVEELVLRTILNITKDDNWKKERKALYEERAKLYSRDLSIEYTSNVLQEIIDIVRWAYLHKDDLDSELGAINIDSLINKTEAFTNDISLTTDVIKELYGGEFFEDVLDLFEIKANKEAVEEEIPVEETASFKLSEFILYTHDKFERYTPEGFKVKEVVPKSYLSKISPDNNMIEKSVPDFLKAKKVKDEFITPKRYDTDPDVLSGEKYATVDMNGKWLPKPDSSFKNEKYETLKGKTDNQSKDLIELLRLIKNEYVLYQEKFISEGERLDLILPARRIDPFETMKLVFNSPKEWINNLRERLDTSKNPSSAEVRDFNQELGIMTKENSDIYTGEIIAEEKSKLASRRKIPIQRVSEDVIAGMLYFISDVHEYSAKNMVAPIFKAFGDVFKNLNEKNPHMNKNRAEIFEAMLQTKIYGNVPDTFANDPFLAKILRVFNTLATFNLFADPIGSMVNLASGKLRQLIETAFTKSELEAYGMSEYKAAKYTMMFIHDLRAQSKVSKYTLLSNTFAFLPDTTELSERMSLMGIASDVRGLLMAPRTSTEINMGMHLGLSILYTHKVTIKGKTYTLDELYTTNDKTGVLELLPEAAAVKDINDKYNPVTGSEVEIIRNYIIQKYTLIQGNYYDFNQSYISNTALGKTAELMKRWFTAGYIRSFQGMVLDPMLQMERVGSHYAMLNLVGELISTLNPLNSHTSFATLLDFWRNGNSPEATLAMRRSIAEMVHLLVIGIFISLVLGYDSDDDDRNKELKQMGYWKQIFIIISLRVSSELGTYIPLPFWGLGLNETRRAILDPFSGAKKSADNLSAIVALALGQLQYALGDTDKEKMLFYQKDAGYWYKEKGDSKLGAIMFNTIGYGGQLFEPEQYVKTISNNINRLK